jgi:hypothetical protein
MQDRMELSRDRELWPVCFAEAFCRYYGCSLDQFELYLFWRGLYRHAYPLARLVFRSHPEFFHEDFDVIREIGPMRDPEVFRMEMSRFYGRNVRDKNWLRKTFSIRVSAKRLIRIKNRIFYG